MSVSATEIQVIKMENDVLESENVNENILVVGDLGEYRNLIVLVCDTAIRVVSEIAQNIKIPFKIEISAAFVTEDEIRRFNKDFRGKDRVTDVLSFGADVGTVNPENGRVMLGDIAICLDKAAAQAREYGHSVTREVAFLVAHSVLHLLGYDHGESETEGEIFSLQSEILERAGFLR